MKIDVPSVSRRIEVVADGLPMWHGAHLAIDATIVSPVTRSGPAPHGLARTPALQPPCRTQPKRRQTHPELHCARSARLVVIGIEVVPKQPPSCAS